MSKASCQVLTVVVNHSLDLRGAMDLECKARLIESGAHANVRVYRDDVFYLQVPNSCSHELMKSFAEDFLAGSPSQCADIISGIGFPSRDSNESVLVVQRKAAVMDPISESVVHALGDAGVELENVLVRTASRYRISDWGGALTRDQLTSFGWQNLANAIVDDCFGFLAGEEEKISDPFLHASVQAGGRVEVKLRELSDAELEKLSEEGGLSLGLEEMQVIQQHFKDLGREASQIELETLAQTWSEHCCHKTFTGPIDYDGEEIKNLLKETIFGATQKIDAPYCLSVFRDNAGVIEIDDKWAVTFKAETHNHPSALEPYGGAGTGVGGCIRDTLGTGLGARPIINTDVFCFGMLDHDPSKLAPGSLHPKRLLEGVVSGVRDYGNRMGIPTGNGAIHFHPGYIGNPLVFVGSIGLIPRSMVNKEVNAGDLIVAIGGRTGRDGIHGATFSSRELTEDSEEVSSGAVQIGNPIEEKKVQDALLRARDEGLYRGLTDCGAGGFSSAVGEMGEEVGAHVELSNAPLKYAGLTPCEIWISEAQERMVMAVPAENKERLFEILKEEEVEGCVLGTFTGDGQLRLDYNGECVAEMSMDFMHNGRPQTPRIAKKPAELRFVDMELEGQSHDQVLLNLLAHPSIASKEPVIRQYDHEVQGRTMLRPLTGENGDAPNDGMVVDPLRDGRFSLSVGCGLMPYLGDVEPYQMGAQSVDEAVRNVISSGGSLDCLVLLDNFAWGNVHDPEILGAAIECARGAADAAIAFGTPFISGKDSLHNTYRSGGVSRSIPHTLLVSAMSVVPGSPTAPSSDIKESGSRMLLVGPKSELSGSLVQYEYGGVGGRVAQFEPKLGKQIHEQVSQWLAEGLVLSCHDLSEGGLAVAAAEMAMGGNQSGMDLDLSSLESDWQSNWTECLFGEGPHRYLIEVDADSAAKILQSNVPVVDIGVTNSSHKLKISCKEDSLVDLDVAKMHECWKAPLECVWPAYREEAVS